MTAASEAHLGESPCRVSPRFRKRPKHSLKRVAGALSIASKDVVKANPATVTNPIQVASFRCSYWAQLEFVNARSVLTRRAGGMAVFLVGQALRDTEGLGPRSKRRTHAGSASGVHTLLRESGAPARSGVATC